ncbi:hypothetical protein [Spirosoma migulaei]
MRRYAQFGATGLAWARRSERVDLAKDAFCKTGVDVLGRVVWFRIETLGSRFTALVNNGVYLGLSGRFTRWW